MYGVRKRLTKDQVLTIPNAMSLFRLLLIPFIVWAYYSGNNYLAVALVVVSAITDMCDGTVARKFNMVSDLGKVLDPLADKLTHVALLACLISGNHRIVFLLVLLVVKEALVFAMGGIVFKKKDSVHSARWHGKLCTVVFESTMIVLMLFPEIPSGTVDILMCVCAGVMLFSLVMYMLFYIGIMRGKA